jgi:pimeloyl-ACP methyl ester carboxylesterase
MWLKYHFIYNQNGYLYRLQSAEIHLGINQNLHTMEKERSVKETKNTQGARAQFMEAAANVRLHITDLGEGDSVVLIHGWPLSDAMFEYQYGPLVDAGYRVIGIGLRGYGLSDKPFGSYDYDTHTSDIKAVLEKLDIHHAVLGGFSMGGAIAAYFVARYAGAHCKKLALFGAAGPSWTKREDFPYGFDASAVDGLISAGKTNRPSLMEGVGKIFAASEDALPDGIAQWLYDINMNASPYATIESLKVLRDTDIRSELHKIELPTVIFHGKKDHIVEFALGEQMHKGIKNSVLIPFENSGHALFYEEKDKFNEELLKFIRQ